MALLAPSSKVIVVSPSSTFPICHVEPLNPYDVKSCTACALLNVTLAILPFSSIVLIALLGVLDTTYVGAALVVVFFNKNK